MLSGAEAGLQRVREAGRLLKERRTCVTLRPIPTRHDKELGAPSLLVASAMPGNKAYEDYTAAQH